MKSVLILPIICLILLTTNGCVVLQAPVVPPQGILFTNYQAPLDYDQDATKVNYELKVGRSSSSCILGLLAFGDSSIAAAALDGDIKVAHTADYEYTNFLFIYQQYSTIVRGE